MSEINKADLAWNPPPFPAQGRLPVPVPVPVTRARQHR